ncbi:hypothetical protein GEMRC1_011866 [Eukaryota sp. GEM-RC1]
MSKAVQTFGRKKTAIAVAHCKEGSGIIKVNGCPLHLVKPEILRLKVYEPITLLGAERFADVDIRIRVRGGGYTCQIYAIRQAIARAIVSYYQKYVDEQSKERSSRSSFHMTDLFLLLILADVNPRNSEVPVPEHASKSHTVKFLILLLLHYTNVFCCLSSLHC